MLARSAYWLGEPVAIVPFFIETALTVIWAGCMALAAYGVLVLLG
jgi:hypothetical protein